MNGPKGGSFLICQIKIWLRNFVWFGEGHTDACKSTGHVVDIFVRHTQANLMCDATKVFEGSP